MFLSFSDLDARFETAFSSLDRFTGELKINKTSHHSRKLKVLSITNINVLNVYILRGLGKYFLLRVLSFHGKDRLYAATLGSFFCSSFSASD